MSKGFHGFFFSICPPFFNLHLKIREELFQDDYIKGNIEKIKKELEEADCEQDELTKSIARAKAYCEANKVMSFNKNTEANKLFAHKKPE